MAKKSYTLYLDTGLMTTISSMLLPNETLSDKVAELLQTGVSEHNTLQEQPMKNLLNAIMYRYKKDTMKTLDNTEDV